ncbi:MAG: Gfo/Idh/MocA family oxidoreductase [Victivallaceae bacterium]|nr:Gfo/Idh/MocA family oxidoreductase [Victivallaceae bacterium]
MSKKLKVAIVGCWGHDIYPTELAKHPDTELVAVCDWAETTDRRDVVTALAATHQAKFCQSLAALTALGKFDLVSINAPSMVIPQIFESIAPYTTGVLLEKPIAGTLGGARQIYDKASENNIMISIAYPTRLNPHLQQVYETVKRGDIGTPLVGSYTYIATNGPLYTVDTAPENLKLIAGGDDTMFMGYAVLDMEYLANSRITKVFARGNAFFYANYQKAGINDLSLVLFEMANGFKGSITTGRITTKHRPPIHKLDLSGNSGAVKLDYTKPDFNIYTVDRAFECPAGNSAFFTAQALVNDFVEAAKSARPAVYNSYDAFHTIAVQEAVKESISKGIIIEVEKI